MSPRSRTPAPWNRLPALAEEEVQAILADLPPELRVRADSLPVVYERVPSEDLVADGVAPDTLGLFVGEAFPDGEGGPDGGPGGGGEPTASGTTSGSTDGSTGGSTDGLPDDSIGEEPTHDIIHGATFRSISIVIIW